VSYTRAKLGEKIMRRRKVAIAAGEYQRETLA
jgi:hypothetical protein